MKYFLFLSMFFATLSAVSQFNADSAILITSNLDTLVGKGSVNKNNKFLEFRKYGEKQFQKYYPDLVKEFEFVGGKKYVSKQILDDRNDTIWRFLEYLVDGEIDVYTILNKKRYFIENEVGEIMELVDDEYDEVNKDGRRYVKRNNKYKGFLRYSMAKAPELFDEIDKLDKISERKLVKLSVDYHNMVCDEYGCIDYTKKIPVVEYKLELINGTNRHNNYYFYQGGVLVQVSLPKKNENLYLKMGLVLSDGAYWGKLEENKNERDLIPRLAIGFHYLFGKKLFRPMIGYGYYNGLLRGSLQAGFYLIGEKNVEFGFSGSIDTPLLISHHRNLYNNPLGHTFTISIVFKINNRKN